MAQLVKTLAKPDDLSSCPRDHMVEGVNTLLQVTSDFHTHALWLTPAYTINKFF